MTHQQVVKEDIVLQSKIHPLEKIGLIIIKVPKNGKFTNLPRSGTPVLRLSPRDWAS